ncbi:MAG TPA: dienelactone hydrolase family protein [Capillimicrobium sp.]|nr:dienelactone hydrolase family protein [Capillimicrobium sp.]
MGSGPHGTEALVTGRPLETCGVAVVALHGRGQDPRWLHEQLVRPLDADAAAFVLPAAPAGSWYPGRYDEPPSANEPHLSRALDACAAALAHVAAAGVAPERTVLAGFSQGACIAATLLARRGARLGGAAILTGAIMGDAVAEHPLEDLPMVVSCSSRDPWIELGAAARTADAFSAAGADVRFLPRDDPAHRVSPEDVDAVRALVHGAAA